MTFSENTTANKKMRLAWFSLFYDSQCFSQFVNDILATAIMRSIIFFYKMFNNNNGRSVTEKQMLASMPIKIITVNSELVTVE